MDSTAIDLTEIDRTACDAQRAALARTYSLIEIVGSGKRQRRRTLTRQMETDALHCLMLF